jgi:hypothetical protein
MQSSNPEPVIIRHGTPATWQRFVSNTTVLVSTAYESSEV